MRFKIYLLQMFSLVFLFSLLCQSHGGNIFSSILKGPAKFPMRPILSQDNLPTWESLRRQASSTSIGVSIVEQERLRIDGAGLPHTDCSIRMFGTTAEPRVTLFRDTAAWCPYCQKVWIYLEEKRIPYRIEKINMRAYGDKPEAFLKLVPNGLLPAIIFDGRLQTESLEIMLNLENNFNGPNYPTMWPTSNPELARAASLMKLEREIFSLWCSLVFRPSMGDSARKRFERGIDAMEQELSVTESPWFLSELSIVDLTYVSHIERMAASIPYWAGFKFRGNPRWPAMERWLSAFEERPSYMATKSDYYTHVMDIPPQYGPGYRVPGSEALASIIDGSDGSWSLPLRPFAPTDLEPVSPAIDPGEEAARNEAAYKLSKNYEAVAKFALRSVGKRGAKQFQVTHYCLQLISLDDH